MWFASDENMAGNYGGYDGPCPPWNDERVHHYITTVYALDLDALGVGENFTLDEAKKAMEGTCSRRRRSRGSTPSTRASTSRQSSRGPGGAAAAVEFSA